MHSALSVLIIAFLIAIQPTAGGQTFETLFASLQGRYPNSALILGSDGNFYGTTLYGGPGNVGTVYKVTATGELTTIVAFNGNPNYDLNGNGAYPHGLLEGNDGNFYGTTEYGGISGKGTVFKVTPGGKLTTLASFTATNGSYPQTKLVKDANGNLYGTTLTGGANNAGTVFKVTSTGGLTTVASFDRGSNGSSRPLVQGRDGNLYGTTSEGGESGNGTIFKVAPAGGLITLVSCSWSSGANPGALIEGRDGNFYGMGFSGGKHGCGTVFQGDARWCLNFPYLFQ